MRLSPKIILTIFFLGIRILCQGQIQIGNDMIGEFENDQFGYSVCISGNGNFVAIGAPANSDPIYHAGQVSVYALINENWVQIGSDINGKAKLDWFGFSVALSDNGLKLVASSHNSQYVRVFEFNGRNWDQIGKDIPAGRGSKETAEVAISANGNIIAVGAAAFPDLVIHRGVVRVYQFKDSDWQQIGSDILGKNEKDQCGFSVSLSADGTILATGSINNNSGGDQAGQARIYKLIDGDWSQQGEDINGRGEGYLFGATTSLSADGNRIAIGGFRGFHHGDNTGYVGIYEFNSGNWKRVGQEINGFEDEELGLDVSLSGDGERVAISSPENSNCPVRIFDLINGKWEQVGKSIKTNRESPSTGISIRLSRAGNRIATTTFQYGGIAQVYDISSVSTGDTIGQDCGKRYKKPGEIPKVMISPNPTSGELFVTGIDLIKINDEKKLILFDALGRKVEGFAIQEHSINLNFIPPGLYFLKIDNELEKIIKISF